MPYSVKVDHPNAGDQDIYIHGLGTFHNGTTTEVDDDQVMRYRVATGTTTQGIFNDEGEVVAPHDEDGHFETRFVLGPEPHEQEMLGVTVTKVEAKTEDKAGEKTEDKAKTPTVEAPVKVVPPETGKESTK